MRFAGVLVNGEVASKMMPLIDVVERRIRQAGGRLDPQVEAVFEELRIERRRWLEAPRGAAATSDVGSAGSSGTDGPAMVVGVELTAADVAERWACTTRNVTDLARRGRLPGRQVSGTWRFELDDVEAFEAERREIV